jgi:hypothetical protein
MDEFEKMASIELDETTEGETAEPQSDYEPGPDAGPELDENAPEEPEAAASETTAGEIPTNVEATE